MITVEFTNQQSKHQVQPERLQSGVQAVLQGEAVSTATVSLAVVDDATIHQLNRRYLEHDQPTDVLSFLLEPGPPCLDGEVIISADTAARQCGRYGWSVHEELLLYAIHGTLHLVGYDDREPTAAEAMREREQFYLQQLGVHVAEAGKEVETQSVPSQQPRAGTASALRNA